MKPALPHALAWAGLTGLCAACASAPPPAPEPAAELTVAAVLAQADKLDGRTLTVAGRFAGWTGPCRGAPPRMRSDWMLVDGAACLYVSGPVPAGTTPPPDTASNGKPLSLRGELLRAADGRPYLRLLP